jgi:Tfp pilus assembly protein PilV
MILSTSMQKNFNQNRKNAMPIYLDSTRPDSARLAKRAGRQGFSFLEVMLVVFILGTSLVVFIQVISKGIGHSADSRDTIIASELAQEGVELVRNIRDNNWAHKTDGFTGIGNNSWTVNYNSSSLVTFDGTGKLKWNNNYYTSSAGFDSKFSRKINVAGDANTKTITSMVVWERSDFPSAAACNAASKCAYAEVILTKWGS